MAVPTNISTLLTGNVVEWARIEFKETWDAEASLKTICAFANDVDNWGGGYIVIGVEEENGRPVRPLKGVPVDKVDVYLKDMLNACKRIQPEYMPIVEVADYEGKKFIIIWAPGGYLRPYQSPKTMAKDEKVRIPYIRKMSSTIQPSQEETRELYSLANKVPFDDRINHEADLSDLNITLIKAYLKEIGSSLYKESETMPFIDLCKSMNIVNTLPEYTKPKNVGLMFFSLEPDKFFPYAQIDVVQFPEGEGGNRIDERIFKGPLHQQLREALLYIRNTGFRKILNALEHNGSPKPLFETDDARTYFATTIFIHPDFIPRHDGINDGINGGINDGINDGIKPLSENGGRVYAQLIKNNTLSIAALMARTGLSRGPVERAIKELKDKGVIHREGAKKNGYWVIDIKLT